MIIKVATFLLALATFTSCQSTTATANRQPSGRMTLQQKMLAQKSATSPEGAAEPAPPAEGPEDVSARGPVDPNRNPGLLPTPLLRGNAAGSL